MGPRCVYCGDTRADIPKKWDGPHGEKHWQCENARACNARRARCNRSWGPADSMRHEAEAIRRQMAEEDEQ